MSNRRAPYALTSLTSLLLAAAGCDNPSSLAAFDAVMVPCDVDAGCGGGCSSDVQCRLGAPRCDKNTRQCVPCLPLSDNCPPGSHCVAQNGSYACALSCRNSGECPRSDGGTPTECCNAACIDTGADRANCGGCGKVCPPVPNAAGACVGGVCGVGACNPGYTDCDNLVGDGCEIATGSDGTNCGACGKVCGAVKNGTPGCAGGMCVPRCSVGFLHCSMNPDDGCEVNGNIDSKNCGACGNACPAMGVHGQVICAGGACAIAQCDPGYANCNKMAGDGCETATGSDSVNCGACGVMCAAVPNASASCTGGRCVIGMCNAGFADCDGLPQNGCETRVDSDIKNCGVCARTCSAPNGTPACIAGKCVITACNPGYADCNMQPNDGCEAQVATDASNCGGCGNMCPVPANAVALCVNGGCAVGMCKFGFADCDKDPMNGCEADLLSVKTCGSCNVMCPAPAHATAGCNAGQCGIGMCDALYGDCNKNAGDGCEKALATDVLNCGACNQVCAPANANPGCLNGQCGILSCKMGFADCDNMLGNGCEVNTTSDAKNCGACGKVCGVQTPSCVNSVCVAGCVGVAGVNILAVMPMQQYGACWYLGVGGKSCDTVCASAGAGTNLYNSVANQFADDCAGGAMGQPATWFFQNGNKGTWTMANGLATGYRSLGHGYPNASYYGKCAVGANLGSGTLPGTVSDDPTRTLVCACSK